MGNNSKKHLDEDAQLMLQVARGNSLVFAKIYNKYFSVVTDYIASHDRPSVIPEDIAQEVFSRIWQNRAKYRPNSSAKTFLFGYAKNVLREEQNRLAKAVTAKQNWQLRHTADPAIISSNTKTATCQAGLGKTLEQAIIKLPAKQRQAIRLTYGKGMSLQRAAKEVNCSREAFWSRLRRGREKLEHLLQHMEP
ncbi:MAG: RNA polymerase sigma factor [Planctomycetota bacterium]|jgi:RNA polymerase sigma-70 factor (ECF subfamily)